MLESIRIGATLPASDIDRAVAWYRDKLGVEPEEMDDLGNARYRLGDSTFLVYPSQFAGTNKATAAAIEVQDLAATVTDLKGRGAEFQEFEMEGMTWNNSILTSPDGLQAAWVVDSEGNILGLTEASSG